AGAADAVPRALEPPVEPAQKEELHTLAMAGRVVEPGADHGLVATGRTRVAGHRPEQGRVAPAPAGGGVGVLKGRVVEDNPALVDVEPPAQEQSRDAGPHHAREVGRRSALAP